jgi:PPE-repeat protein
MTMLSAALPYVAWMTATAAQAEEHALAAMGTATAFETAHAAVIHPAVIAENRAELATLVATNFLGVNSAAIAANEAEYSTYWATDASTMTAYAGELSAITGGMVPFVPPIPDADPAGPAADAAAVAQAAGQSAGQAGSQVSGASGQLAGMPTGMGSAASMAGMAPQMASSIPGMLGSLGSPGSLGSAASPLSSLSGFQSFLAPLMGMGALTNGLGTGLGGISSSLNTLSSVPGVGTGFGSMPTPLASIGRSAVLPGNGVRLSVPAAWAESVKPSKVIAAPLASTSTEASADTAVAVPGRSMIPAAAMPGQSGGPGVYPAGMRGSLGMPEHERPRSLPIPKVAKLIF